MPFAPQDPRDRTAPNDAVAAEVQPARQSLPVDLTIAFRRYLRWLVQLQATADTVCDDAYTLDRLIVQGVLPLRQRYAPPTAAQVGLTAAVYELMVGAAEREHAHFLEARQQDRAWKLTGSAQGCAANKKAAMFSQFPPASLSSAGGSGPADSAVIMHSSTPPCPCRVFLAQQRAAAGEQRSRSGSSSSSDEKDRSPSHGSANGDGNSEVGGSALSSTHPPPTSAPSSLRASFPARLNDTVRAGSGPARATRRTAASASASATSSLPEHANSAVTPQLLLPVTAAWPARSSSATSGTAEEDVEDDKQQQQRHEAAELSATAAASLISVSPETLPSRMLHPIWTHVSPEDVRRCSLCSGQLLIEGSWHALYLLQQLTVLSAAPSMAAPLPLPPPTVLKVQPVEALLLLLQTAQRCFVLGVSMASAVSVPPKTRQPDSHGGAEEASCGALDTSSPNAGAAHPSTAETMWSVSDVLRGGHSGGATTLTAARHQQAAQSSKEGQLLCALTQSILGVVDAIAGTAGPSLWPPRHKKNPFAAGLQAPLDSLTDLKGDVLALRLRIFHAAFLVLATQGGANKGATALVGVSHDIAQLLTGLRGAPHAVPAAASTTGNDAALIKVCQSTTSALTSLKAASGDASDDLDVLDDDLRTLCCVAALLAVFADLVRAQEAEMASLGTTASDFCLPPIVTHLMDALLYPALVELQSSSRGNCSSQARPLLALWWLMRAETVRQTAAAHHSATTPTTTLSTTTVLEQEVSVAEEEGQTPGVVHWSAWVKEASRAAVRASNAASEFLRLTFSPAPMFGASSPLRSPAPAVPLRWQLPCETADNADAEKTDVACLPLAWLRMWFVLCPPLFHISPTDALMLRHALQQQQQQQQQKSAKEVADSAAQDKDRVTACDATLSRSNKASGAEHAQVRKASQKVGGQTGVVGSKGLTGRASLKRSGGKSPPPLSARANDASPAKLPKSPKAGGHDLVSVKSLSVMCDAATRLDNGKPTYRKSDTGALQQRLQFSTASVYFWTRWSQLFLSDSSRAEAAMPSPVAAAVSGAIALLRNPSLVWRTPSPHPLGVNCTEERRSNGHLVADNKDGSALRRTQLIVMLHRVFPLLSTQEMTRALAAQARLFLTTSGAAVADHLAAASDGADPLFNSYSFASLLPSLREVVVMHAAHHDSCKAAPSLLPTKPPSQLASHLPAPFLLPSPPRTAPLPNPAAADGAEATTATARSTAVATVRQSTRRRAKLPPLMAARPLARHVADAGKPSSLPQVTSAVLLGSAASTLRADVVAADSAALEASSAPSTLSKAVN
ncbi:hypothetical protein N2W54_000119 [Lotmaria passim]